MGTTAQNAGFLLSSISASQNVRAVGDGVVVPGNPWFTYHQCNAWELAKGMHEFGSEMPVYPPSPDWSTWDGSSRVFQFLNSIDPESTWAPTSGDESIMGYAIRPASEFAGGNEYFRCIVPDWLLPWVSGQMANPSPIDLDLIPPIWPGASKVTMGGIASLAPTWSLEEPMNGIVVSIASTPPGMGRYDFGIVSSWMRAAYVTFLSDAGGLEAVQPITFDAQIVCPKLCRLATRAIGRAKSGVEGYVQAWTYTTP